MLESFFNGIVLGCLLAILIGPVFFSLIETSIRKGFYSGVQLAIGIMLSDLLYISITYTGLAQLMNNQFFKTILGIGGGAIMIVIGISSIIKKHHIQAENNNIPNLNKNEHTKNILKGFLLNTMNPSVLLFWIGAVSYVNLDLKYTQVNTLVFFTGTICITFATDLGKIYIANKIKEYLNDRLIKWLNITAGIGLLIFGIKLMTETVISGL